MPEIVIQVENLSKKYLIKHNQEHQSRYKSLRDTLSDGVKSLGKKLLKPSAKEIYNPKHEDFWALKDISFEIKQGDRVGIIGRNGAGKSTLLKILSRITEPSTGSISIKGRVASLLEVGTGFHPELTGRENIYLNGAILGMSKTEIKNKFDEIVAFAEVERFLDTPVKRYSSGMYVRLAFAVAAHLEPEILIVDEVLAVGDAQFQKKCLGKMSEVSDKSDKTVFFVSHNMTAVQSLCDRVIWLNSGSLIKDGHPKTVISNYLNDYSSSSNEEIWDDISKAPGNDQVRLHRVAVIPEDGISDVIKVDTPIRVEFEYWNFSPDAQLNFSFTLYDIQDICIFNSISPMRKTPLGLIRGVCYIPGHLLNDGTYKIKLLIVKETSVVLFGQDNVLTFDVNDLPREGAWHGKWVGAVRPNLKWELEFKSEVNSSVF
ncbi:MAG: ABC transporter ATP-binding protein [Nostoc sp. LLA-1]|nr:ABC transporter ATP-binding protein [Cyanocohniella sp. LLY]